MCNKGNMLKKFFVIVNNSSAKLQPEVISVFRNQQLIEDIYKRNILYEEKYLNSNDIKILGIKNTQDSKLQIIPVDIPFWYFFS
jgi:hypothetical protein